MKTRTVIISIISFLALLTLIFNIMSDQTIMTIYLQPSDMENDVDGKIPTVLGRESDTPGSIIYNWGFSFCDHYDNEKTGQKCAGDLVEVTDPEMFKINKEGDFTAQREAVFAVIELFR